MADPHHHALSSVKEWGGIPQDYLPIHNWFDSTKRHFNDPRHRALRHHSEGIGLCIDIFGQAITLSTCKTCGETADAERHQLYGRGTGAGGRIHDPEQHSFVGKEIPTRWVAERHVLEDFGYVPTAADFLRCMEVEPWMVRGARKLSREL